MFALLTSMILLACYVLGFRVRQSPGQHACPRRIRDGQEARLILRKSSLESRAIPNQRLVMAFGINNAFTSTDADYHRNFVSQAKELIRTPNVAWTALAISPQNIVDINLMPSRDHKNAEPLRLVKFVQSLDFRIVIIKFFPRSGTPSNEDVDFITANISFLWLASKSYRCGDPVKLVDDIKELLRKLSSFIRTETGIQAASEYNTLN